MLRSRPSKTIFCPCTVLATISSLQGYEPAGYLRRTPWLSSVAFVACRRADIPAARSGSNARLPSALVPVRTSLYDGSRSGVGVLPPVQERTEYDLSFFLSRQISGEG